jgi:pyruvate ferredoxin oxidoreductase alpha subunit
VSFGGSGGPVFTEIKSALYNEKERPLIYNSIIGLGGRDVPVNDFVKLIEDAAKAGEKGIIKDYEYYGVRG